MRSITPPLSEVLPTLFDQGFIAFCGAGVSIPPPCCSPSWWMLTEEILKSFFSQIPDDYNLPKDMILKDPDRQPEEVFEAFSNILDERMYRAFEALDVAEPNANHYALARLAKMGILKVCFTTNFDIYLENGFYSHTWMLLDGPKLEGPPKTIDDYNSIIDFYHSHFGKYTFNLEDSTLTWANEGNLLPYQRNMPITFKIKIVQDTLFYRFPGGKWIWKCKREH